MSVLTTFDTTSNFWKMNPQFKALEPYKEFHAKDKTRGKKNSSKVMWAIALLLDPSEANSFRNIPVEDRAFYIARDFIGRQNFNWDKYVTLTDFYKNQVLSQAAKSLITWEEVMNERDKVLKTMFKNALKSKDIGLITELDKLLAMTPKYYMDYEKIRKAFMEEEDAAKRGKGDKIKSLSDTGEI